MTLSIDALVTTLIVVLNMLPEMKVTIMKSNADRSSSNSNFDVYSTKPRGDATAVLIKYKNNEYAKRVNDATKHLWWQYWYIMYFTPAARWIRNNSKCMSISSDRRKWMRQITVIGKPQLLSGINEAVQYHIEEITRLPLNKLQKEAVDLAMAL